MGVFKQPWMFDQLDTILAIANYLRMCKSARSDTCTNPCCCNTILAIANYLRMCKSERSDNCTSPCCWTVTNLHIITV